MTPATAGLAFTDPGGGCLDGHLLQCAKDVAGLPGKAVDSLGSAAGSAVGGVVGDVASSAWDSICHSFADAFTQVLQWFGGVFAAMPDPDLGSIRGVYAITLTIGMIVALFLLVIQAGTVLWTRSGAPLAQALTGLVKAALAALLTLAVATQLLKATDQLAAWIVAAGGTSMTGFSQRLTVLLALNTTTGPEIPAVLLLLFGLLGIVTVLVLWFELVLRNAAFCVLVATAPIAAAGQIGAGTSQWWRKLVKAGVQLAILKPVIALVFVLGFDTAGSATGITGLIGGLAVLFMAVFAWPAIARFFTFTSTAMGGAMGVGALVGAAANRGGAGRPGIDPAAFAGFSQRQAMAANAARAGSTSASAGAGGAAGAGAAGAGSAGAATGAATAALGAAAGPAGIALAALQALHKTVNTLASRMEQQAGHAGLDGANPTAYPAGYPGYGSIRMPNRGTSQPATAAPTQNPASPSSRGSQSPAPSIGRT